VLQGAVQVVGEQASEHGEGQPQRQQQRDGEAAADAHTPSSRA
jgi:hypothetical protein